MPATVKKLGGKYRVVEKDTGKLVTKDRKPVDGGGHVRRTNAVSQATAINISQARDKDADIPKKR